MSDRQDVLERLTHELGRAAALRAAAQENVRLQGTRRHLRAWQAARLARTHADLLASPRMGLAAAFFLSDLYGSEDLIKVGANVRRVVPAMRRLLPTSGLQTVAQAFELEALSEDLDFAMTKTLGTSAGELTASVYAAAYRKVGRRADRDRQIDLIEELCNSLDHLVHQPFIGATLSMMHGPARLAGLSELQDFLQRGYDAFIKMDGAGEFVHLVVSRERTLLVALLAGDDSLLGQ